ncbi:MAG TPA: response regulator transcription factor [Anaerolineales bacterium]
MDPERIRILIADDHAVVRKGLAMVLRLEPDFEVVAEAGNGRQTLDLARQLRPDLILLDRVMPEMDGQEIATALRSSLPGIRILILTGTEIDGRVLDMLAAGVDGYVLKEIEPDELKQAIRAVARGEGYLQPAIARQVLTRIQDQARSLSKPLLTPRELEVLQWLKTPKTYRQIADELNVSEETVRSHAKSILNKLGQPNRGLAVLAAVRAGLLELSEP